MSKRSLLKPQDDGGRKVASEVAEVQPELRERVRPDCVKRHRVAADNNVVTDGPYMEIKESLGGYAIVKAGSFDEAADLAKGCPVFGYGGNVEVREIMTV